MREGGAMREEGNEEAVREGGRERSQSLHL